MIEVIVIPQENGTHRVRLRSKIKQIKGSYETVILINYKKTRVRFKTGFITTRGTQAVWIGGGEQISHGKYYKTKQLAVQEAKILAEVLRRAIKEAKEVGVIEQCNHE